MLENFDPETKGESKDIVAENIAQLKQLFPEVFTEDKVDFTALQVALGEYIETNDERYNFTWHGKTQAKHIAQTPSTGTLRPCKEESKDWDTTQNLFIEGDNLEVLKLLQKAYHKQVKMIYIDPPYNTGKEFIYPDNYQDNLDTYLEYTGQKDSEGRKFGTNAEVSGRYHTNWLNMMYPRLRLARNLLSEDGVICVSIDDHEVENLKKVMSEIFGEENFQAQLIWDKQHSQQQGLFKRYHEYLLIYSKNNTSVKSISGGQGVIDAGALKKVSRANPASEFTFPPGVRFDAPDGTEITGEYGESEAVKVIAGKLSAKAGKTVEEVTLSAGWTQKNQMRSWFNGDETFDSKGQKVIEFYFSSTGKLKSLKERQIITPPSILPRYGMVSEHTKQLDQLMGGHYFDTPKPINLIKELARWFTNSDDIVMDFFVGSGTTGHSIMELNAEDSLDRRFIVVQLPEPIDADSPAAHAGYNTISDLSTERLRRAGEKIKADNAEKEEVQRLDTGFKLFKLDSSNIKPWDADFANLERDLVNNVDNIKYSRSADDVLYELLLKYGIDLAIPIETHIIAGKTVSSVGLGALLICLDDDITLDVVEGIGKLKDELQPETVHVVLKDAGLRDDVVKTNALQLLKRYDINDVKTL